MYASAACCEGPTVSQLSAVSWRPKLAMALLRDACCRALGAGAGMGSWDLGGLGVEHHVWGTSEHLGRKGKQASKQASERASGRAGRQAGGQAGARRRRNE
jgi:hypothetical protein